jgi:hypothetical protein
MTQIDRVLRSNIKLRHLQLVVALDQFRHLGRTAEFLSVSQPAVSKMLGEVESMLELTLFERSTRGTEPTPAARPWCGSRARCWPTTSARATRIRRGQRRGGPHRVGSMVVAMPVLLAAPSNCSRALGPGHGAGRGRRPDAAAAQAAPGRAGPVRRPAGARLRGARPGDRGAVRRTHGGGGKPGHPLTRKRRPAGAIWPACPACCRRPGRRCA